MALPVELIHVRAPVQISIALSSECTGHPAHSPDWSPERKPLHRKKAAGIVRRPEGIKADGVRL